MVRKGRARVRGSGRRQWCAYEEMGGIMEYVKGGNGVGNRLGMGWVMGLLVWGGQWVRYGVVGMGWVMYGVGNGLGMGG